MTGTMSFEDQLQIIRNSGQLHGHWYNTTYPDVALAGLEPAEHYLRFGALLGRRPQPGFDTRYYQDTNPDVVESGLNPLVHYVLYGKSEGRLIQNPSLQAGKAVPDEIKDIRNALLGLGITYRPQAELSALQDSGETPAIRAAAAHELALWHLRTATGPGCRTALEHIAKAWQNAPSLERRTRLITLELLCNLHLRQTDAARTLFERAGIEGLVGPDVLLAWANFFNRPEERLQRMNMALRRHELPELALLTDRTRAPYDRLTVSAPLTEVTDGPKVTVLIAASEAAAVIGTALRSLQEQTWKALDIIVLDDCSADATCAVVEGFAAADHRIRLVRMPEKAGPYVAYNEGLDLASGDFVTIHDAGGWAHPLRIETQVRCLQDNPKALGCTIRQATADADLGFTRWSGEGDFILPEASSLLFRRDQMRTQFGYWDNVRFAADAELIRRMTQRSGASSVIDIQTGPLAFSRAPGPSGTADNGLEGNGFLFGALREYHDAQTHHYAKTDDLRYEKLPANRRFPVPALLRPDRHNQSARPHFEMILASDFRMDADNVASCVQDIRAARAAGCRVGLIGMYRYDRASRAGGDMLPALRAEIDGEKVQLLTYGEDVTCDLLLVRYPPILQNRQRYLPRIEAATVKVIVNQPPMNGYGKQGTLRYELERCTANLRHYFGKDATWHPIGPLMRETLVTRHAKDLHHIDLSPQDWTDVLDLPDWERGPRKRGPTDRLRIGRHAPDSATEWPASAEDILSAYPDSKEIEVHVLGGASAPARIIGKLPKSWTVDGFTAMTPKDFLTRLDVFVYFNHPETVESIGRNILEAMAVGLPVILPETFRQCFGDAALYATPQTAVDLARGLHADPAAYDAQARKARDHVKGHHSAEVHLRRLKDAGLRPDAPL